MTKTILTRILNQTEPSLPRRNKQEFREFKKDSIHSSKNHLPLLSRTRHPPEARTKDTPSSYPNLNTPSQDLSAVSIPSPPVPTGMDTRQIRPGGLLCLLFVKNQNELSSQCSVWANRPESQGQSNMIQNTVEPIVREKGQGTSLPSVGKVKTTKTAPKGPSARAGTEESGHVKTGRLGGPGLGPRSLAAQSCVREYGPACGLDAESSP